MTEAEAFNILDIDEIVFKRMREKERFPGECLRLVYDIFMQKSGELVAARDKLLEPDPHA